MKKITGNIVEITSRETYPVRHEVLRKGKPIESCAFPGDDLQSTVHFGYYEDENLIGIVSVFKAECDLLQSDSQMQLRGMAVAENHQQKGIGAALIRHVESLATRNGIKILWFNARESAVSFYQKLGYKIIGNSFDIPEIGVHYKMYKLLE